MQGLLCYINEIIRPTIYLETDFDFLSLKNQMGDPWKWKIFRVSFGIFAPINKPCLYDICPPVGYTWKTNRSK